jgi:uncharacterized protein (TIGR00375 family)
MKYIADLHVHSKFSRATARNLDLENYYVAAQLKGVTLVGTGDFTHPGWFEEISSKLVPAEPGLYRLDQRLERTHDRLVPDSCRAPVRYILTAEISSIYKKRGKTRKNHNLVVVPDLDTAARFSDRLERIGNIHSDGRPILGLDARDLLEILLETSDRGFLIPAHIWTPWFSMFGSKSGFDSLEACFEDLTGYIFAAETGLSSDPPMNWRVSDLDGITLVSNSDAHSPSNLGREANILDTELSFDALRSAIESGRSDRFLGTIEFYPEEGKYHLDGHRNCGVRLWPRQTVSHKGICPVCAKPLTVGVLYRVEELADHETGRKPEKHHAYCSLIPLAEVLADILKVGSKTKKVARAHRKVLETLGPELQVLQEADPAKIEAVGIPLLGEALSRMREGRLNFNPGYDGEYGRIEIFDEVERKRLLGQRELFSTPSTAPHPFRKKTGLPPGGGGSVQKKKRRPAPEKKAANLRRSAEVRLNDEQRRAVVHAGGAMIISAGPGTGKTRTLTQRIARLIRTGRVSAAHVLAVTFTNKAAREMQNRLKSLLGECREMPTVATFHALCYHILNDCDPEKNLSVIDDEDRLELLAESIRLVKKTGQPVSMKSRDLADRIAACKQQILDPDDIIRANTYRSGNGVTSLVYRTYQRLLNLQGLVDYEDLVYKVVRLLERRAEKRRHYRRRFRHIFVDEYQDINEGQYRLVRALAGSGEEERSLCVIGDPDQSIYGFRGSKATYFRQFREEFPDAARMTLTRSYRSTEAILRASHQVIVADATRTATPRVYSGIQGVKTVGILESPGARAEAEAVVGIIEQLIGGTGFHALDTRRVRDANLPRTLSYADFVVLSRTKEQQRLIGKVFFTRGIPHMLSNRRDALKYKGIAELLALLRLLEGCGTYMDVERTLIRLAPGVGPKTLAAFKQWCYQKRLAPLQGLVQSARFPVPGLDSRRQQDLVAFNLRLMQLQDEIRAMAVKDKLLHLLERTGLAPAIRSDKEAGLRLGRILEMAAGHESRCRDFLTTLSLEQDGDIHDARAEKVALMTMHAAKGLEFPVVFVTGCEEGLIPYRHGNAGRDDEAEERRLLYVAMTRAREQLYLSWVRKRRIHGRRGDRTPSPFLIDIEEELKRNESSWLESKKKQMGQIQLKLF